MRPGATPKLKKSARLSSSAPKRDVPLIMRATRPSTRVEHRGEHDGAERQLVAAFEREPDAGQAGAQREQRDDVGHEHAHRDLAQSPQPALALLGIELSVLHG